MPSQSTEQSKPRARDERALRVSKDQEADCLGKRELRQFAESVVVAIVPPRFTPIVVVPEAKVFARPGFTAPFAMVATVGTVELQWELTVTS